MKRWASETDPAVQCKLDEDIKEAKEQLNKIDQEIEDIDQKIKSYKRGEPPNGMEKTQMGKLMDILRIYL